MMDDCIYVLQSVLVCCEIRAFLYADFSSNTEFVVVGFGQASLTNDEDVSAKRTVYTTQQDYTDRTVFGTISHRPAAWPIIIPRSIPRLIAWSFVTC